ncbi:unnamed protein product, partial [Pocillopora meandrina]
IARIKFVLITGKSSKKFGSEGLYSSHNATRAARERERVIMADDKKTIEQFVETTRQIGIIVSDFQPGSQGVLNQKILICFLFCFTNSMMENMREIEKCKAHVQDVEVPLEVFE